MCEMILAFETERLRVFTATVAPWPGTAPHALYLAFLRSLGPAQPVAYAVVSDWRNNETAELRCVFCQVIEVSSLSMRNRYGEELWRGIEDHLGVQMRGYAVTDHGRRFLERLGREADFGEEIINPMRVHLDTMATAAAQSGNAAFIDYANRLLALANDTSQQPSERIRLINIQLAPLNALFPQDLATPPQGDPRVSTAGH